MTHKFPICPDRIRKPPEPFSWGDHRLVRDRPIERLSHEATTLYLFRVTVADCQGLSYDSDPSLCERSEPMAIHEIKKFLEVQCD